MATTPPQNQQLLGLDINNVCKGLKNIYIDGTPVGIIKPGENIPLREASKDADSDIMDARHDGSLLGQRRGGVIWEFDFTTLAAKLENYKMAMDTQGSVVSDTLAVGEPNQVATFHELVFDGEAPQQRTRRATFFKTLISLNGDILLGTSGADQCEVPMKGRVCKDVSRFASQCYFQVYDYDA